MSPDDIVKAAVEAEKRRLPPSEFMKVLITLKSFASHLTFDNLYEVTTSMLGFSMQERIYRLGNDKEKELLARME